MSDAQPPARTETPDRSKSAKGKVQGRLKVALSRMIWEGVSDNRAAAETGITVVALRLAMKKPFVKEWLRRERDVVKTRELGRNLHALISVRDQEANQNARVAAVRAIEQLATEPAAHPGLPQRAGLIVVIKGGGDRGQHTTIQVGANVDTAGPVLQDQHPRPHVGPQGGTTLRRVPSPPPPAPDQPDLITIQPAVSPSPQRVIPDGPHDRGPGGGLPSRRRRR